MSRALKELHPAFRATVVEFLARLVEAQIPVLIVCTGRTDAEQAEAVRTGASQVTRSRHQDGMAIDLCPYETFQLYGPDKLQWRTEPPEVWRRIGAIGEALTMRWGGRFRPLDRNGLGWDCGHFEWPARMTRSGEEV